MPPVNRNKPVRAKSSDSRCTVMEFIREFPDDATCLEWLWRNRYSPDGENAYCPKCETERPFKRYNTSQQRQSWTCTGCGYHLHPTAGTIFHKSSTSLHLWFYAMYLMTSTRCGISAKQLERELGVTYKTAWRMAHLIRHELMDQNDGPLSGFVEVDETFIGGRERAGEGGFGLPRESKKAVVLGMVERRGNVRAIPVESKQRQTLLPRVINRVLPRSVIYTDEALVYDRLDRRGYHHRRVHHAMKVYVSGDAHTNTIEGFWSLVKRGIDGVYHAVSAKHLQGYLNEYAWRYNRRNDGRAMFETLLVRAVGS
jgi:transposase